MKKLSFIQVNYSAGPKELNAYHLPYSVGRLWAYAQSFDNITQHCELHSFIYKRENIEELAKKLADCSLLAVSYYLWNDVYNSNLIKAVKKLNPNCIVVAGGPQLPVNQAYLFEKYSFIDFVVKVEGELIFKGLLEELISNNFQKQDVFKTKGLLINRQGKIENTGSADRIDDLDQLVSPYLSNVFVPLMEQNPDVLWNVTIETNRGCPYQCTFCDWGSLTYSKLRTFKLETVLDEIEWCAKHGCDALDIADSNFGILKDRDLTIADKIAETREKYKFPKHFSTSYAKNQKDDYMLALIKKLSMAGVSISVQTLTEDVLNNIKRFNTKAELIKEIFVGAEKNGLSVVTEFILGLPGETKETWKRNYFAMYELNNHHGINSYQLEFLENAPMNLWQKYDYDMEYTPSYFLGLRNKDDKDNCDEIVNLVRSTKDMPYEDMVECFEFNLLQYTFHISGITTWTSRLLYKYINESYESFYEKWFDFILNDPWFKEVFSNQSKLIRSWLEDGEIKRVTESHEIHEVFQHTILYALIYEILHNNYADKIFNLLQDFITKTYGLDERLVNDLIDFSKNYLVTYETINQYDNLVVNYSYDIYNYIVHDKKLDNSATYKFFSGKDNKYSGVSKRTFIQRIYFNRRTDYGLAKIETVDTSVT